MIANLIPLLTAHIFISKLKSYDGIKEMIERLYEKGIIVKLYGPKDQLIDALPKKPRVYVSIGSDWKEFESLKSLPLHERKRWLHFESPEDVQPFNLFYCWLKVTDPLPENRTIPETKFTSDTPLVSVFTASYRSKDKILRPYRSLLNQTYPNWEWVIVDDSGDDDETYKNFLRTLDDPRVRRYRQDSRNGYIGSIKRYAAGLCTGEILVEVDHDDELMPDCLEKIVNAFKEHPECGFAYGDCTEVYAENNFAHWYGWDCGYGYSVHYRVWIHKMNRWQNVQRHTTINGNTLRHLVGLPNHPRAWTRDCYHLVGGHREELLVGDDYDLLIRTFLCTKYVAIPELLYIQYRNKGGDNSTFQRNRQIQILVNELKNYYHNRIYGKIKGLGMPELVPYNRVWLTDPDDPARKTAHVINENPSKVSILFPLPYSASNVDYTQLYKTLEKGLKTNFNDIEVVVVGNVPYFVEQYAAKAPTGAIRWWPMERDDTLECCIEYAKYCTSCKEKIVVMP
ncbi:glycosyltransferase [Calidifontibacillus erzurumensis]|uniref:Glycosyltransferase n=1 Tax=Calidifontibacillus erzurumensis TaxID=2741433 RepID=A0A8J8K935_9BACI|nr:glycosyltransferase [Calidifontibacillus erzurumensis]NSL52671.1 glycosyltransferase [Calidifontibacillus erzurumensis]